MQATSPTFYGTVTVNGSIVCAPTTGRKVDIYSDGATIYGFGLNDFEYCVFGGQGSAFTYRIATPGATGLAGEIALFVDATGVGIPVGRPISWGTNTLLVDAAGALLVNGAPLAGGGGGASGTAAITGGTINGATIGGTAPAPVTGTVLTGTERLTVGASGLAATAAIYFNAAAGQVKQFVFQSGGLIRWTIGSNNTAEAGGNSGSNFTFSRWDDTGNWLGNAIEIARATGLVLLPNVDIEGGGIDNTPIGATTPSTGRFTTLALTASLTAKFVLVAPNAAAGAPTWRQLLYTDLSGFPQRTSATGLTASTTNTQAGAIALTAAMNNITTAAANSAVRLPNAAPATGFAADIIVRNGGANPVNCFPPSGSSINALAANASISIPAGTAMRFQQLTATLYVTV